MGTTPDIRRFLDPLRVPDSVKAQAWDDFYGATDQQDFQRRFDRLQLPIEVKADLWDAKFGATTAPPPAPAPAAVQSPQREQPGLLERAAEALEPQEGEGAFRRFGKGVARGAVGLAAFPFHVAGAAARPPETTAEKVVGAVSGPGGLALKRTFFDPQVELGRRAREAAEAGETAQSLGYSVAAGLPIFGSLAAGAGERAGTGDIAGAVGEAAALIYGPKVAKRAARRAIELGRRPRPGPGPSEALHSEPLEGEFATEFGVVERPTEVPRPQPAAKPASYEPLPRSEALPAPEPRPEGVTPLPRLPAAKAVEAPAGEPAPAQPGVSVYPRPERPPETAPGSEAYLYSNPLPQLGGLYTRYIGEPIWKLGVELFHRATPEFVKRALIPRYGQPAEYVEVARRRLKVIPEGVERGEELGQRLGKDLTRDEQQALGRLVKGEATELDLLRMRSDARWRDAVEAAKQSRAALDTLGGQAVAQGLLKDETFFRNYGKYMPRLYRKYELDYDGMLARYGERKPARLDLDRFRQRKDIPEEVRAMMGEIEEPAYPVARGIAQLTHDVETARLFNTVADNPEWAVRTLDDLPAGKSPLDYVQMPESKKLGRLSGTWVQKDIATDLNQIIRIPSEAERVGRALLSEWKWGKVIANPATHARNMLSNTILGWLGGLSPLRVDVYATALYDLAKRGRWFQEAKAESNLLGSTYLQAEFGQLLDSWSRTKPGGVMERIGEMAKHLRRGEPSKALAEVSPSQTRVGQKLSKLYQAEEQWFKLAKYIHNREKGISPKAAAADAEKWLFNYQEVPQFIDWARRSPFGAPFITFTYKALPVILESAVKYPWRIGAVLAVVNGLQSYSEEQLGLSEAEKQRIERALPERMKGGVGAPSNALLPYKDADGRLQYLDLSYILPWGDIGETGATGIPQQLLSNPAFRLTAELAANRSLYTGRELYKETDTPEERRRKLTEHVSRTLLPSLAPGGYGYARLERAATGRPDYLGHKESPAAAVGSAVLGLKTTPIDVREQEFFRRRERERAAQELRREAYGVMRDRSLTSQEAKRKLEAIHRKVRKLRKAK